MSDLNKGGSFLDVLMTSLGGYVIGSTKTGDSERVSVMIPLREKKDNGFLYLIIDERNGLIKIGWSLKPLVRERTLQSEVPQIKLIKYFPANKFDETFLHDKYSDNRVRGEWFNLSKTDLQDIYNYFG